MCYQIFPFVRAHQNTEVCLIDKNTPRRGKKFKKKQKQKKNRKFLKIFLCREISKLCVQLIGVVTKRAFSLSLSLSLLRERQKKSFTQILMTTSGSIARRL